jgi:hypothetical protein
MGLLKEIYFIAEATVGRAMITGPDKISDL